MGKGRIKKGFALVLGLAVSVGAVRTSTRGCQDAIHQRLSRALCVEAVGSGGRHVESWTEPSQVKARSRRELTGQTGGRRERELGGAGRRGLKLCVTQTLVKKIWFSKSSRAVYYFMKTLKSTFGKQTASSSA